MTPKSANDFEVIELGWQGLPPGASAIKYGAGQTRANNTIMGLGTSGEISVRCVQAAGTAHVILDVNGDFE